jgi:3-oxoacyl-[acyl-carrier-protein] synthase II
MQSLTPTLHHPQANHIRAGEADVMVVGGSEAPIIPVGLGGFVACRALSQRNDEPKRASRPWDQVRQSQTLLHLQGPTVMMFFLFDIKVSNVYFFYL